LVQAVIDKASASCDLSLDSEETSTKYTEQSIPLFRPQTNGLASLKQALMEKSSSTGHIRFDSEATGTIDTETFDPLFRPQSNSLAMALGMKIDISSELQLLTISVTKVRTLGQSLERPRTDDLGW
jgi:hypothetical protein